jgi:hypothetical protein
MIADAFSMPVDATKVDGMVDNGDVIIIIQT